MSANNEVDIISPISMMSDEVLGSLPTELRLVQLEAKSVNTYEH